jgi:hypothetical protein
MHVKNRSKDMCFARGSLGRSEAPARRHRRDAPIEKWWWPAWSLWPQGHAAGQDPRGAMRVHARPLAIVELVIDGKLANRFWPINRWWLAPAQLKEQVVT